MMSLFGVLPKGRGEFDPDESGTPLVTCIGNVLKMNDY